MTKNMGSTDKTLRIIAAIILGILYFTDTITGVLGTIILIIGIILLLTSFIGYCPLYSPFKISTIKKDKQS